ncbi:ABC transporter ATP-binding protein [Oceanirhabdus seepicola]|uniref:ABC transporter ATP-binding protein n=2 Tax=Oceanirhabdus seepicola TaxID=2828781 RepID=A0A9J6P3Y2_9CLOT|nr:ABC transporter ATP-binding protein [Oceanirhabdus seepicola]
MNDIAIKVENLNLKYIFINSMGVKKYIANILKKNKSRTKEVLALTGVSFELEKGKTLGIIGSNGSGKSTLLRVLAQLYTPDIGKVALYSESVALLALGTGFQPELTGIENIYLSGLLLGMSKETIDKKINEIVEFSGIGDFVNSPVKTYSSGMKARLGFSIATNIEPDILLIDEILGVGDEAFKKKSNNRIKELIESNKTVVLVSHSVAAIREVCDCVLWLHKGEVVKFGDDVIGITEEYRNCLRNSK